MLPLRVSTYHMSRLPANGPSVDCTLECGHIVNVSGVVFRAAPDEIILCPRCFTYKHVTEWVIHDKGYGFKCRDCRYARFYGMANVTRDVKAGSHAVRRRHSVALYFNGELERMIEMELVSRQMDLLDIPPF